MANEDLTKLKIEKRDTQRSRGVNKRTFFWQCLSLSSLWRLFCCGED